ncbi:MAG TPA: UdgX family uracil-DNA binding protein [Thermoleophilaceae bacterium]|nr:UdgX family uracil-DNA binding protein [Thermoleophilaceae bacterium]
MSPPAESRAEALVPEPPSLPRLREAAAGCTACELHEGTTQTVFGEGSEDARLMLVGEQPGDREDIEGHPFVGPAGKVLAEALDEAGIDRSETYVTNVVKHFNFQERGKRRIHQKPSREHVAACHPWLRAELRCLEPEALVCLGATAAKALLGPQFRVTRQRGQLVESDLAPLTTATVHPSSILRQPDHDSRLAAREAFVDDLRAVARAMA